MEGLGSSAESLASTRSVQTVIHMENSQGAPVDGGRRQENMTSLSPYCPMQLDIELHHDSKYSLPETHNVENIGQESGAVNEEKSSSITALTLTAGKTSCHTVCSSAVPNIALSDTHVVHSGKKCLKSDNTCVHCGKFFQDHRNEKCAFQDADLSACLSESVLPQFSVGAVDDHCNALDSQGTSLNVVSAVNMLGIDNTASAGDKTQDTETQTTHDGHKDLNSVGCYDDQESTSDPKFTSHSGHQPPPEDVFEPTHDVSSVNCQPEKLVQTTSCKLEFPAELSQHYTIVDSILETLKNSIEKVTSQCNDSDRDGDVKITLQQTTEHLDWPEDVSTNIAPEKLDHIRGVPYIKSAGRPVFPVKLSSGINVELTRSHSLGSPHVCKKYVLVEETKRYTKIKDSVGGKEDVKEVAVRRKKEVTAPPTADTSGLWESLPENEKQESGEKALLNLRHFVEEAKGKFLRRREVDCDRSEEKSPNLSVLSLSLPAADKPLVEVQGTGKALDQGLQKCERKDEQDDTCCHAETSSVDMKQQSDVRRDRAPSVAEELNLDIMEPVNRYTAEGIASDLQKTSSEVSIANNTGTTEDHSLQDYWALAALVMSSRHEKLSEIQLGPPGHYDLHYTSPKEHLIREVELARCCMTQYRGQLVQLELMFAQCYAAFYNHMTGQERLEVELLVLLRAEVLQEAEALETMLASHLQAVIKEDPAVFVEEKSPSSLSKLKLLGQLIELLKEQGQMQQALAVLVQNSTEPSPAAQPGLYIPALSPQLYTWEPLDPQKKWELLAQDRERIHREVTEIREELHTEREDRQRVMDKNLHKLRMSIMADVRQEIAEQMKLLRLQLQAKEEEVRMLRLQMRQQTKTQKDEVEGGSQRTKKSIRVTQL